MRSTAVRFICRVLIALVALYAANDGLLQTYLHDGSDGIVRPMPGRTAMPVLAPAGAEDERDFVPALDGPTLLVPTFAAAPVSLEVPVVHATATPVRIERARHARPGARAPPTLLPAQA